MLNRILIDSQVFTAQAEYLSGTVSLRDLDKRIWLPDIADLLSELHYTLTGGIDRWQRPFLAFTLSGCLKLYCQRCMQVIDFPIDEKVKITLFHNEKRLDEAMMADEELEGMLLSGELNVFTLVEDQILMALPISPRHEHCDENDFKQANQDKSNPFSVLMGLRKG